MIATDRDALLCDLAETYHIYDLRALPVSTLATLACGLRPDARSMMRLSGTAVPLPVRLQAAMLDDLNMLVWAQTKDGQHGRKRPESVLRMLEGRKKRDTAPVCAFADGASFDEMWKRLTGKGE